MWVKRYAQAALEESLRSWKANLSHQLFEIRMPIKWDIVNLSQNLLFLEKFVGQVSFSLFLEANDEQMPGIAGINLRKFEMIAKRFLL